MEALNRVRRDVAALGADAASAPPVDSATVDRITTGLRAEPTGAAHAVRRGRSRARRGRLSPPRV